MKHNNHKGELQGERMGDKNWDNEDYRRRGEDQIHDLILIELKSLKSDIKSVDTNLDSLSKKIFIGNGQESIMAKITRNTLITKCLVWTVGVAYSGVLLAVIAFIIKAATGIG